MKKIPLISDGKTPLVWRQYPYGGHYAGYKLGTIVRNKGEYMIIVGYRQTASNCKSVQDAKARIDKYTQERIKQLQKEEKRSTRKITKSKKR